jgi:hypothetical protein
MRVCEFGCGGSTLFFADLNCEVFSIEHDAKWSEQVRSAAGASNVTIKVSPPVSQPAGPACPSLRFPDADADFRQYIEVIAVLPDHHFDLILVDGRVRVAAACAAMGKVRPGGIMVLDNAERPDYAPIHQALRKWTALHIWGLGRKNLGPWQTSFWTKPQEATGSVDIRLP